jgi:hypothetical protein
VFADMGASLLVVGNALRLLRKWPGGFFLWLGERNTASHQQRGNR